MRTILAALALTLTLSASVAAQSLMIDNAEYRIGMTLEEAIKTAKMWDQQLEWDDDVKWYRVYRAKPDKNGIVYCGHITTDRGKVEEVTHAGYYADLFTAYSQFALIVGRYKEKFGDGTVDTKYWDENEYTNATITVTASGKTWSVEFMAWKDPTATSPYSIATTVSKKK